MRIAVIKNIKGPGNVRTLEALAAREDCEVLVVYEAETEPNRRWRYSAPDFQHVVLQSRTIAGGRLAPESFVHLPRSPLRDLRDFEPDVVVASGGVWNSPTNALALAARGRYNWAFVPWWGEFEAGRQRALRRIVEPWVRTFVRGGDAWLTYSDRATNDVVRHGGRREHCIFVPNVSDAAPAPARPEARPHDTVRFLFSGQLNERKGIRDLLGALGALEDVELWVAGDGPLGELMRAASGSRLNWLGHVSGERLHALYDECDVLVMPSRYDIWGLVVNEALEHGMPVICTDQVAAGDYLIDEGVTGVRVPARDPAAFAAAMAEVAGWSHERFERARDAGQERMRCWTPEAAADAIVEGCRMAIDRRAGRA